MDDKMGPCKVFVIFATKVTVVNEVNEEEVGDELVEEVLEERITKCQKIRSQYMMALRDEEGDTIENAEMGVGDRKIATWN